MLDEPVLPSRGLDTIFLGLTFSVTGEPRASQPEPATRDLLATAPPAGIGAGVGAWCRPLGSVPGPGRGRLGPASGAGVGSVLASPRPLGPGAGLHVLPPRATSSFPGCRLSSGVPLGQFSPIPPPGFGGFPLGEGLEGHRVAGESSPRGRKGSCRSCAEPPTAGECRALSVGEKERQAAQRSGVPTGQTSHHADPSYSSPCT